ncbi:MAG: NAD-dependent epimerase/dehydratase family protein [Nitrospirae bacterium]|nr:NAD-dependent epimerase/dehydratase family protein [Nitrospirota bacterium]
MRKVLITGTHGFLGRHTASTFKKLGYNVTGVGHGKWENEHFRDYGIDAWFEADITFDSLKTANSNFDIIVHCAGSGSVGDSIKNPALDFQKTVDTSLAVLEYMRISNPEALLIYPSSSGVYGEKDDRPISETEDLAPASPYGSNKKTTEELCRYYSNNFGLRISIIRFFSLYGNGLKKQLLWDACKKLSKGENTFYGTGEETRDFLHIDDATELIYRLAETNGAFEIFNGAAGRRLTIKTILNMVASELGKNTKVVFDGKCRKGDPRYYHADISKALKLGWCPNVTIENGIKAYIDWYKRNDD